MSGFEVVIIGALVIGLGLPVLWLARWAVKQAKPLLPPECPHEAGLSTGLYGHELGLPSDGAPPKEKPLLQEPPSEPTTLERHIGRGFTHAIWSTAYFDTGAPYSTTLFRYRVGEPILPNGKIATFSDTNLLGRSNLPFCRRFRVKAIRYRLSGGDVEDRRFIARYMVLQWDMGNNTHIDIAPLAMFWRHDETNLDEGVWFYGEHEVQICDNMPFQINVSHQSTSSISPARLQLILLGEPVFSQPPDVPSWGN